MLNYQTDSEMNSKEKEKHQFAFGCSDFFRFRHFLQQPAIGQVRIGAQRMIYLLFDLPRQCLLFIQLAGDRQTDQVKTTNRMHFHPHLQLLYTLPRL